MKKCLRKKCQQEFEPNKPKQVFCSAKCRVYFSREERNIIYRKEPNEIKQPPKKGTNNSFVGEIKEEKSTMPDPKDKVAYLKWLRAN